MAQRHCSRCGRRPVQNHRGRYKLRWGKASDLCRQCYRSELERQKQARLMEQRLRELLRRVRSYLAAVPPQFTTAQDEEEYRRKRAAERVVLIGELTRELDGVRLRPIPED